MTDIYAEFYTTYKSKLFSYLMRMSGDYDVSRDIMQESFTRHYQNYARKKDVAPSALFTIARNALIDHWRKQNKIVSLNHDPPSQLSISLDKDLAVKEELRTVVAALKKLPDDKRGILSMAVSGLSYKHISEVMGISEANVKIKIHRARLKLHQIIGREDI